MRFHVLVAGKIGDVGENVAVANNRCTKTEAEGEAVTGGQVSAPFSKPVRICCRSPGRVRWCRVNGGCAPRHVVGIVDVVTRHPVFDMATGPMVAAETRPAVPRAAAGHRYRQS